jgi:hypothetical protein
MSSKQQQQITPAHDPSTPPVEGRCVLPELPRELRDMIWKFALTAEHGMVAHRSGEDQFIFSHSRDSGEDGPIEFNQLRYTNKQLRQESKGLVFKLNDLSFPGTKEDHGRAQATEFIGKCSLSIQAHNSQEWLTLDHLQRCGPRP